MDMTISELISILQDLKAKEGDVRVFCDSEVELETPAPVVYESTQTEAVEHGISVGGKYVII